MENRMVLCSQRAEVVSLAVPHQEICSPATPLAQRMVMRLLPVPRAYLQSIGPTVLGAISHGWLCQ